MKNSPQKIILLLCAAVISCNSKPHDSGDNTTAQNEIQNTNLDGNNDEVAEIPKTDEVPKEFMRICQLFYDEVCFGYSSPKPKLNENGTYILDLTTYKENLQSLNIFTSSFIQKQDELFSECTKVLAKDSITPDNVPDGIDVSAPMECGFFHYNYYLHSQERPDGFYLKNSKFEDAIGVTEVHFYNKTEKSYFNWDNQIILSLELKKVNETWKICNVQKIIQER